MPLPTFELLLMFPLHRVFLQRAPSWRTRGPSGSGSRRPCCGTTWPWPATRSAPRRRSTRWRSRGSAWHSRSTASSTTRGGTSPRRRRAVSDGRNQKPPSVWFYTSDQLWPLCLRCDGQRRSAGVCDWCLQTTLMWEQEEERLILLASHSVTVTAVITHSYMWSWEKCQKQSSVQENNKKNIER